MLQRAIIGNPTRCDSPESSKVDIGAKANTKIQVFKLVRLSEYRLTQIVCLDDTVSFHQACGLVNFSA